MLQRYIFYLIFLLLKDKKCMKYLFLKQNSMILLNFCLFLARAECKNASPLKSEMHIWKSSRPVSRVLCLK